MTPDKQLQDAGIQFYNTGQNVMYVQGRKYRVHYYPETGTWNAINKPNIRGFGLSSLIVSIKEGTV